MRPPPSRRRRQRAPRTTHNARSGLASCATARRPPARRPVAPAASSSTARIRVRSGWATIANHTAARVASPVMPRAARLAAAVSSHAATARANNAARAKRARAAVLAHASAWIARPRGAPTNTAPAVRSSWAIGLRVIAVRSVFLTIAATPRPRPGRARARSIATRVSWPRQPANPRAIPLPPPP